MRLTALRPVLLGGTSQSRGRLTAWEITEPEWVQPQPPRFSSITATGGICVADGGAREEWLRLEIAAPLAAGSSGAETRSLVSRTSFAEQCSWWQ